MNKRYQEPPPCGESLAKKIIDGVIIKVIKVIETRTPTPNNMTENRSTVKDSSVWIFPLCSVEFKQKPNIGRHKNLNCADIKPLKIKPPKLQTPPLFKCKKCRPHEPHGYQITPMYP